MINDVTSVSHGFAVTSLCWGEGKGERATTIQVVRYQSLLLNWSNKSLSRRFYRAHCCLHVVMLSADFELGSKGISPLFLERVSLRVDVWRPTLAPSQATPSPRRVLYIVLSFLVLSLRSSPSYPDQVAIPALVSYRKKMFHYHPASGVACLCQCVNNNSPYCDRRMW